MIKTAILLFEKKGIPRNKAADICDQAGISNTAFYKYFKSKNVLICLLINKRAVNTLGEIFHTFKADNHIKKESSNI